MEEELFLTLNSYQWRNMKTKNSKILLACSYGPDSMALFDMLLKQVGNNGFEVAHVNYRLREESDDETKSLIEYCDKKNVKIYVFVNNKDLGKSNLEAKCRKIRYEFFSSIYKNGFNSLYIAHNQDDLIETYLMQKQRRNIVEFYGIKQKSRAFGMNIVRPLLSYKKSDLLKYCEENNVPYAIDKTNLENTFLRNRIRHEVVEKLSDLERRKFLKEISLKNKELDQIKKQIKIKNLNKVNEIISLNDREFAIAINMLIKKHSKEVSISKKYALEIKKALQSDKPNLEFEINLFLALAKSYNDLKVVENKPVKPYSYVLKKPGVLDTKEFFLDFSKDSSNRNVYLDSYPITIRTAKANDQIKIKDYFKSARRLFIDWKMPKKIREKWPVILDNTGKVVYMPRYQADFKVEPNTNFYVK